MSEHDALFEKSPLSKELLNVSVEEPVSQNLPQAQPLNILSMIEGILTNPEVDVNKLEKIIDLQERMIDKASAQAFAAAMSSCQGEMPSVVKQGYNKHTDSKYAKFENILEQTKETYTKHGFALSFGTDVSTVEDHVRVTCDISHKEGHSKHFFQDLPIDSQGIGGKTNKTKMHGAGSTFTYGRRYIFTMIFNIAVKDSDNDGNATVETITPDQVKELTELVNNSESDLSFFCTYLKISKLEELYAINFDNAKQTLEKKIKKLKG